MRISEIEIHEFDYEVPRTGTVDGNWVYDPDSTLEPPGFVLTIRTADGTEGRYRGFSFTPPMIAQIRMVAEEHVLGRDPLARREIWQDCWRALRHTDRFGVGPIDVALWDLAGRHYGESVSTLLGGGRDSLPTYASTMFVDDNGGLDGPEAVADFAETCLDRGYGGFKFHGHPAVDPDLDVAICEALAERVGDRLDLMLDASSLYRTYADALAVGRALDDLGFFWYEDPFHDGGVSERAVRKLVAELDTPMLGLEHVRTGPYGTAGSLATEATDLVRASAHLDGGITGALKIAETAESFGVDVELLLGGPAHAHLMSALRNSNYFEHGLLNPESNWILNQGFEGEPEAIDGDGRMPVPDDPGLGVDIDWAFVERRRTGHTRIDG
ncbi:enolase C-terminal domain-like protein [Haloplanus pelagicus]|jgi:L-alanine-DL-glutamate epimerase-like enolase superfamily enzyme|uniref:enolase C-terminal domain-like protein n=1 Tax=Haloplanus pelagicus TaxID=2949995 RepID=UPI00203DE97E|nr:enolase C-terminal domain-like protein [Haloplanus sp. HW8-1]